MFGGHAGQWLDPCYHQICDDLGNLNHTAWEVNTKVSFLLLDTICLWYYTHLLIVIRSLLRTLLLPTLCLSTDSPSASKRPRLARTARRSSSMVLS